MFLDILPQASQYFAGLSLKKNKMVVCLFIKYLKSTVNVKALKLHIRTKKKKRYSADKVRFYLLFQVCEPKVTWKTKKLCFITP